MERICFFVMKKKKKSKKKEARSPQEKEKKKKKDKLPVQHCTRCVLAVLLIFKCKKRVDQTVSGEEREGVDFSETLIRL